MPEKSDLDFRKALLCKLLKETEEIQAQIGQKTRVSRRPTIEMVGTKDLTERNNCKDTELKLGLNEMEEGLSKDFCFFAPQSFSPLSWKSILVTERGGTFLLTRACNPCFSYTVQSIRLGSVQTCLTKSRRQWQ